MKNDIPYPFQVEIYAAFLHDAAMLYAHALNKTLNMNGTVWDGHLIIQNMYNYSFNGKFSSVNSTYFFCCLLTCLRILSGRRSLNH